MKFPSRSTLLLSLVSALLLVTGISAKALEPVKIVLLSGTVKEIDRVGHHDYLGGCLLMQHLLEQTPGTEIVLVKSGWPEDESVFQGADAVVFYTDGAGKQAYLQSPERIAKIQSLVDEGVGITCIHQAVEFSSAFAKQSAEWIGATYTALSGRGHWDSKHESFPAHPVSNGVTPWEINDGWLNQFKFASGGKGITPLVWSGKVHLGSSEGGSKDVVAWTFDRANGGRSFSFSGLDAHSAWERPGVRKIMINGILWTAGFEIPDAGAMTDASQTVVDSFLTPRIAPAPKAKKKPAAN